MPHSEAIIVFNTPKHPEVASVWPTLDFIDPISRGSFLSAKNISETAFSSVASTTYLQHR